MLPSGYREVEYIESTGTQWILTGLSPSTSYDHTIAFSDAVYDSRGGLFGSSNYLFSYVFYSGHLRWCTSNSAFDTSGNLSDYHVSEMGDDYLIVDGVSETRIADTNNSGNVHALFYARSSGVSVKVYHYSASLEGVPVIDFIPCKRLSDGAIGMYDLVSQSFFGNSGTGEFIAGDALLFEYRTTYIGLQDKVYGTFPYTLTASDFPQYSVQGHEIRTEWYYDAALTQKANVGDVITETVTLYEKVLNVNKAEYMGEVQIDLTGDTITEEDVPRGVIFHKANGFIAEGSRIVNPVAEENDVIFLDYDGTIRYSYTLEEIQALTELPPAPDHFDEGLVFQEWNWTLQEIKDWGYECEVGANYTTVDGATKIFVTIPRDNFEFGFRSNFNATCTISFGDGTTAQYPGSGYIDIKHTYSQAGEYVISMLMQSGSMRYNSVLNGSEHCITKIFTGDKFRQAIDSAYNLKAIAMSTSNTTLFNNNQGVNLTSLQAIVLPRGTTGLSANACKEAGSLKYAALPCTLTALRIGDFVNCFALKRVTIPMLASFSNETAFLYTYNLEKYIFPDTLTTITSNTFTNTYFTECRFLGTTPPTLGNTAILGSARANCIFLFPYASTDYLTATNYPNPATYAYVGFKKSTNGETLPTSVGSYSLTWYASKGDAQAQTNPITTGNGKEVYARYAA